VPGRHEIPYMAGTRYIAFCDPAGGSGGDSMTLAIAHRDRDGRVVLDLVRETKSPFSPETVVAEFAVTLKDYHVNRVFGDRYAGEWPREQFRKRGVEYRTSERPKTQLYSEFLPLINSGRVELLDNNRLVAQLCSLERRTGRGTGRDVIDHPSGPGWHDDICNAVGGVVVTALSSGASPMVVSKRAMDWASGYDTPRRTLSPAMRWASGVGGEVAGPSRDAVIGQVIGADGRPVRGRY